MNSRDVSTLVSSLPWNADTAVEKVWILERQENTSHPLKKGLNQPRRFKAKLANLTKHSSTLKELFEAKANGDLSDPNDEVIHIPARTNNPKKYIQIVTIYADGLLKSEFAKKRDGYDDIKAFTNREFWSSLKMLGRWADSEENGYGQFHNEVIKDDLRRTLSISEFMKMKDRGFKMDVETQIMY